MERHGVFVSEVPTTVLSSTSADPTVPVVFGAAPVNLSQRSSAPVNEPLLITSYTDAVTAFGYSDDWGSYPLCEFMNSHFLLYKQAPVVFVNVLDPAIHKTTVAPDDSNVTNGVAKIGTAGIIKSSVIVKSSDGDTTYSKDTDYTVGFDASGFLVVTRRAAGTIPSDVALLKIGYDKLNPAALTSADIIGGLDASTGAAAGLELVNQVFPQFQVVPGLIVAPGYSHDPLVATVMTAKASLINGHFKALALADLDVESIAVYTDAPTWKQDNGFTSEYMVPCFPFLERAGKVYHFSTHLAGVICATDTANDNIPFVSPSNKTLQVSGVIQHDGLPLSFGPESAEFLNAQGIVTALRFFSGIQAWGNRTSAYPISTDPVDAFIPIRRMFNWITNQIILRNWRYIDNPMNTRLIETVTDEHNIWLNSLQAAGAILGGRVEFNKSENADADLMDGRIKFHLYITPPGPAQEIAFVLEYDVQYLQGLFPAA